MKNPKEVKSKEKQLNSKNNIMQLELFKQKKTSQPLSKQLVESSKNKMNQIKNVHLKVAKMDINLTRLNLST